MKQSVPTALDRIASRLTSKPHRLLIGGEWVEARSGKTFPVYNPSDGGVIAQAAEGDRADVDAAVSAARAAFDGGAWRKLLPGDRAALIWKLADAVEAVADDMALIEALDTGKPVSTARSFDVQGAIEKLRYFSGWATKITGESIPVSSPRPHHAYTVREPLGVAGLIVPWNAPLLMAVTKLAPSLAAGCTVVLKPAEQAPLAALYLGELAQEVGFPPGAINIVTGYGETAGAALAEHPGVDKISFTGSTEVGRLILRASAGNFKRLTLELGGKSPVLVFPDADIERAIEGAARAIFFNTGQVCSAGSRLFAHKSVFDQVVGGIAAKAETLRVGPGLDPKTEIGPVISREHLDRVTGFIDQGIGDGATVLVGGHRIDRPGYFVQPTILTDTTEDMSVRRSEIFGPVLCAMSFSDASLDQIAAEANDTSYGLAAHVFTRDLSTAHKIAARLRAGSVRINGGSLDNAVPSGGFKQSGWGRENGREGVEAYTETKSVVIAL
jgi:acyl-CoA reductase-like NAD-dependent aldehyde dehydrogenase